MQFPEVTDRNTKYDSIECTVLFVIIANFLPTEIVFF